MGAVPLPQRQPHCELVSPPTSANIAAQLPGTVCKQISIINTLSYKAFTKRLFHSKYVTQYVWHPQGVYTAPYEETYSVPPIVDAEDLWRLAHQLSMQVASSFDPFQFHTKFFNKFGQNPLFLHLIAAQHGQVDTPASSKAENVFQDVFRSWRRRRCVQVCRKLYLCLRAWFHNWNVTSGLIQGHGVNKEGD